MTSPLDRGQAIARIERLIRLSLEWRDLHRRNPDRPIDSLCAVVRARALIEALEIIGGDGKPYKKECGVLR